MHWTHKKALVSGRSGCADIKVGTDAEIPRTGRIVCIERIQPVVAGGEENAVAIGSLEKNAFHAV